MDLHSFLRESAAPETLPVGGDRESSRRTCGHAPCPIAMHRLLAVFVLLLICAPTTEARTHVYQRQGQVLEIDVHERVPLEQRAAVIGWVHSTADALATVYGHWPRDLWRVRVRPMDTYSSDPVPWAQVNRGSPDVVSFYIDPRASEQKLVHNWTAYHEFSHLLIPYRGWGDMWFSEGLASYYQNLLQARHGVFDEREMWQRLHDGFIRGRVNRRPDLTLAELSPVMRENGSYMRVYWSGAWYFMTADLALRRQSGGRESLDSALRQLNACCADQEMSAREIAVRLDQLTGAGLFVPLFDEISASLALPAFEQQYAALGIELRGGSVALNNDHRAAQLRRDLATGSVSDHQPAEKLLTFIRPQSTEVD